MSLKLFIVNQQNGENYKISANVITLTPNKGFGYSKIIKAIVLEDSSNRYLVNDIITFGAHITIYKEVEIIASYNPSTDVVNPVKFSQDMNMLVVGEDSRC